jgi:hypothetical protein
MKRILLLLLNVLIFNIGCSQTTKNQDTKFIEFINSFEEEKSDEIIDIGRLIYSRYSNKKTMTKDEALSFVYKTEDTTVLYCTQTIFSMDTEEVFGIDTSLYLPDKYFRIEKENYFLLCYSSYNCRNRYGLITVFLHLLIIDKNYNIIDKLLVENCDDTECYTTSLINPKNGKIFLKEKKRKKSIIYLIDENLLTYKVIKESTDIPYNNNLSKDVKELGWEELFFEE